MQLAAYCDEETFSTYVLPNKAIDTRASEVTGISVISSELYSHGQKVESATRSTFVELLKPLVIPVAHNCRMFDSYKSVKSVCNADMLGEFQNVVNGFANAVSLLKTVFKDYHATDNNILCSMSFRLTTLHTMPFMMLSVR